MCLAARSTGHGCSTAASGAAVRSGAARSGAHGTELWKIKMIYCDSSESSRLGDE